jgi:hypothetical protein
VFLLIAFPDRTSGCVYSEPRSANSIEAKSVIPGRNSRIGPNEIVYQRTKFSVFIVRDSNSK